MENVVVPTLKAFSLRAYDPRQVIIAGGDQEAVVISPSGSLLASIELPAPPTHTLILEDFSGDGLTDVIWGSVWVCADEAAWGALLQHARRLPDSCDRSGVRFSAPVQLVERW